MIAVELVDLPATRRASHDAGRIEPGCHLAEGAAIPAPGLASTRRRPAAASDVGMDTPSPWSWTSGSAELALSGQGAYRARWLDQAQVQRSRCGHRKGGPGGEPRRNGEGSPGQSDSTASCPALSRFPTGLTIPAFICSLASRRFAASACGGKLGDAAGFADLAVRATSDIGNLPRRSEVLRSRRTMPENSWIGGGRNSGGARSIRTAYETGGLKARFGCKDRRCPGGRNTWLSQTSSPGPSGQGHPVGASLAAEIRP